MRRKTYAKRHVREMCRHVRHMTCVFAVASHCASRRGFGCLAFDRSRFTCRVSCNATRFFFAAAVGVWYSIQVDICSQHMIDTCPTWWHVLRICGTCHMPQVFVKPSDAEPICSRLLGTLLELHYDSIHIERYLASGKTGQKRRASDYKIFSSIAQSHRLKLCQRAQQSLLARCV